MVRGSVAFHGKGVLALSMRMAHGDINAIAGSPDLGIGGVSPGSDDLRYLLLEHAVGVAQTARSFVGKGGAATLREVEVPADVSDPF